MCVLMLLVIVVRARVGLEIGPHVRVDLRSQVVI